MFGRQAAIAGALLSFVRLACGAGQASQAFQTLPSQSACEGAGYCQDDTRSSGLLQVKTGRGRESSAASCKNWCYDSARNLGISWAEKCSKSRCRGCTECQTTTTTTTTTTTRPALPVCQLTVEGNAADMLTGGSATHLSAKLVKPPEASGEVSYSFEEAPAGLSVNMRNGAVTWQPDISQAGEHYAIVSMVFGDSTHQCLLNTMVTAAGANPSDALYVAPGHGSDSGEGTIASPFASVAHAVAVAAPGQTIYVRGGAYVLSREEIVVHAPGDNPVVVTRLPGERVRFTAAPNMIGFRVMEQSSGVTFRGLELYGAADADDHWEVLRTSFWRVQDIRTGGKTAFDCDGTHIIIEDCVIHDFTQKAVNIYVGRYVTVRNNIIYNIGHASLSGGHGIMRKWERTYNNDDDLNYFRFDFYGNLLFGVEQRIYSFIPSKGYCNMEIDEGKGILLDITKDTVMKARVAHNLVLYGGVDGIRLKWNPNLQVHNNAILTENGRIDPIPDGITAKNNLGAIPNMSFFGNLVETFEGSNSYDVAQHFSDTDYPQRVRDNYFAGGGQPVGSVRGIEGITTGSLFKDAANLDFTKSAALQGDVGVSPTVLSSLMQMVQDYAVDVKPSGFRHDHEGNLEAIEASAPWEHLEPPTRGPSKREPGRTALYYKVKSKWYRQLCRCRELEMITPHYIDAGH